MQIECYWYCCYLLSITRTTGVNLRKEENMYQLIINDQVVAGFNPARVRTFFSILDYEQHVDPDIM